MTGDDYKQLEHLLGKLEGVVGNKICIIPNYIYDGYHIGVYNGSSGEPVTSATGTTIKETVEKLKQANNGTE